MQTCSTKWKNSRNQTGVFLYKCSPRTKHNWHCTIRFLINTASLNVYFMLHCHLFFLQRIFSKCLYFSEYNIWMFLVFRWEISDPLSTYATGKMCTGAYRMKAVEKLVIRYVLTKWMAPSKYRGICFVHGFGQVY